MTMKMELIDFGKISKELRQKLVSADLDLKKTYSDRGINLTLTNTFSFLFKTTKEGPRLHRNISIEDKLKQLMGSGDVENRDENSITASHKRIGENAPIKYRNLVQVDLMDLDSGDSSGKGKSSTKCSCYLCK